MAIRASAKVPPAGDPRILSSRILATRRRQRAVLARARAILGDDGIARDWLTSPNGALGGQRPLRMLRSKRGTDLVLEVLGRIDHDLYS